MILLLAAAAIYFAAMGLVWMALACAFVAGRLTAKWEPGRQGTGYEKLTLARTRYPFGWDLYLIRFPPGSRIDWHTDPVSYGSHHRLNIVLKRSPGGGNFMVRGASGEARQIAGPFIKFRPDIEEHMVTEIIGSPRYVLSLGWLWN